MRSNGKEEVPPWLSALARSVRAQRKALGLTQREVSELAGCGPVFIYDLEHGEKPTLRLDKLLDVLAVLGLRLTLEPGKDRLRVEVPP